MEKIDINKKERKQGQCDREIDNRFIRNKNKNNDGIKLFPNTLKRTLCYCLGQLPTPVS
jgi:hypothetical protein